MTRTPPPVRRPLPEGSGRVLHAERRDALDLAFPEAPVALDFSLERWLDRLEASR